MVAASARHANIELLPEYKYVMSSIKCWLLSVQMDDCPSLLIRMLQLSTFLCSEDVTLGTRHVSDLWCAC